MNHNQKFKHNCLLVQFTATSEERRTVITYNTA